MTMLSKLKIESEPKYAAKNNDSISFEYWSEMRECCVRNGMDSLQML